MARRGSAQVSPDPTVASQNGSPPAVRRTPRRWRDPRLVVGVALVALCALLGARVFAGADDTVGVWVARHDLAAGQPVRAGDVERREVGFADATDADRYVSARQPWPDGARVGRPVGAGELLPRAALETAEPQALTQVPLSVGTDAVPATVRAGSVVDVWVTPDPGAGARQSGRRSTLAFDDVAVVSAPRAGTSLGPTATRQVIIGVGPDQQDRLPTTLAALATGTVLLTLQR
jgi:hypothetical protein